MCACRPGPGPGLDLGIRPAPPPVPAHAGTRLGIGQHAYHVRRKNVQGLIICPALQPLLDRGQIYRVLTESGVVT